MQTQIEKPEAEKALKVAAALRSLADEYTNQGDQGIADQLDMIAEFPAEDLAQLYDLINAHDTPAEAVTELQRA